MMLFSPWYWNLYTNTVLIKKNRDDLTTQLLQFDYHQGWEFLDEERIVPKEAPLGYFYFHVYLSVAKKVQS